MTYHILPHILRIQLRVLLFLFRRCINRQLQHTIQTTLSTLCESMKCGCVPLSCKEAHNCSYEPQAIDSVSYNSLWKPTREYLSRPGDWALLHKTQCSMKLRQKESSHHQKTTKQWPLTSYAVTECVLHNIRKSCRLMSMLSHVGDTLPCTVQCTVHPLLLAKQTRKSCPFELLLYQQTEQTCQCQQGGRPCHSG